MSPLSRPFGASLLLLTFLHLGPLQAADWPRFRGPNGDGKSEDTKVPTEWSETSNLKWKLDLPGAGFSSPIVVGKHVLVTCFSGSTVAVVSAFAAGWTASAAASALTGAGLSAFSIFGAGL